ncbi:MAG: Stk1 family PASTA domain-containing Ser/Thr kinase, partial [Firmicutes bacterium]|nr:Stk1 family PASTA domain-containing Ser/Thr kinase [Bacillota bacterium]
MAVRILAGRYELNERIGEGGMAVVFRSRDRLLDRNVAIKILRPEYTKDLMFIDSFRKESQLAASIVDPNIVNVYDVGKEGNIYYIVMELVEGEPLSDIIKREAPLDPRRAVSITRQIAMALSTAHKHQLIHRDVKPHNILISEGDTAKISDFGIAIKVDPSEAMSTERKDSVMGSIHYFSPEQARGAYVDERSDIYSLGIVLYEMLTGQVPFDGETAVEVALKHMNEPMVPPSRLNPDIPQDLEDIIMKATAKIQTNRYASADEMITDLSFVKYSRPSDYAVSLAKGTADRDTDEKSDETPEEKRARIRAEKRAERRKKLLKKLGIGVGVVALIVAPVLIIGKIITRGNSRSFPAPYLIGMTYNEALVYLKDFELKAEIELELISEEPAGTIISQSPVEDTMVKPGQTI